MLVGGVYPHYIVAHVWLLVVPLFVYVVVVVYLLTWFVMVVRLLRFVILVIVVVVVVLLVGCYIAICCIRCCCLLLYLVVADANTFTYHALLFILPSCDTAFPHTTTFALFCPRCDCLMICLFVVVLVVPIDCSEPVFSIPLYRVMPLPCSALLFR